MNGEWILSKPPEINFFDGSYYIFSPHITYFSIIPNKYHFHYINQYYLLILYGKLKIKTTVLKIVPKTLSNSISIMLMTS